MFHICNCGFGILVNFDAVLRFLYAFLCSFAVFRQPLHPPLVDKAAKILSHPQESNCLSTNVITLKREYFRVKDEDLNDLRKIIDLIYGKFM